MSTQIDGHLIFLTIELYFINLPTGMYKLILIIEELAQIKKTKNVPKWDIVFLSKMMRCI